MKKKVLLINDIPGYGKVAIPAMTPVLVKEGFEVFNLPTAILSNTLNFGKFALIDTTRYMKEAVSVWKELGIKFDAISVGFIANDSQAVFLADYCRECAKSGTKIFVDPIMGDNGKLYNSVTTKRAEIMKQIIKTADCIVPNMTEACVLTEKEYSFDGYSEKCLKEIVDSLRNLTDGSVLITSAVLKDEKENAWKAVAGYDRVNDKYFTVNYDEIPVKVNGTGDIFAAKIIAESMNENNLEESVRKAADYVRGLIEKNLEIVGEYNGLPVEEESKE